MVVICCGSRTYSNRQAVVDRLSQLPSDAIIVHGGATGGDTLCDEVARELGLKVKVYKANWSKDPRRAGFYRNMQMIVLEKPDLVVAFRDKLDSRGTNHMIYHAHMSSIAVEVINADGTYHNFNGSVKNRRNKPKGGNLSGK